MSSKVLALVKLRCPLRIPLIFMQPIEEIARYGNLVEQNNKKEKFRKSSRISVLGSNESHDAILINLKKRFCSVKSHL